VKGSSPIFSHILMITKFLAVRAATVAVLVLSLFVSVSNAQRQTKLYIDDGSGNFSILQAASGGGTVTMPAGSGTLALSGGSGGIDLQGVTPGVQQLGNINVNGTIIAGGPVNASLYQIGGSKVLFAAGGPGNLFVGLGAGPTNTGLYNTFSGVEAGFSNVGGSYNTFSGYTAGQTNTTGDHLTVLGAGADVADGLTDATAIGAGAYASANNATAIGANAAATSINTIQLGDGSVTSVNTSGLVQTTGGVNLSGANAPLKVGGSAGTSGQVLTSAGTGNTPTWGTYEYVQTSLANPAVLTTTNTMDGISAGTYVFTPSATGKVLITMAGTIETNGADKFTTIQMVYGTGTGPAHGDAAIGNPIGAYAIGWNDAGYLDVPFSRSAYVSGLTVGAHYWVDAIVNFSVPQLVARVLGVEITVIELP
jgi:hypothetical protein